jgi:hypothetical protein
VPAAARTPRRLDVARYADLVTRPSARYRAAQKAFGSFPRFDPQDGETVLEPPAPGPGHWVGAPSVLHDPARDVVLLTYRLRRPRGEPDERGYECRVAESKDGVHFDDVWSVRKGELGSVSLERFNLHRDTDGRYLLYLSYLHPEDGRWRIDVVTAADPHSFDVRRAQTVLRPESTRTDAVKDPYVVRHGAAYLMYVSTFLTEKGPAPTSLAVSTDGVRFRWLGTTFDVGSGWDRYQTRLSCIVAVGGGYVGLYDGAGSAAEDTEERLGAASSHDLRRWERLSSDEPWLVSPHPPGSLRYPDVLDRGDEWWVYYEYGRADGSHELRLNRLPKG